MYDARYRDENATTIEALFISYLNDPLVVAELHLPADHPPYAIGNRSYSTYMAVERFIPSIPVIS